MENQARRTMTLKEQTWLDHVTRAHQSGQPLSHYAQANGLEAKALYRWQSVLRQRGRLDVADAAPTPSAFMSVRVEPTGLSPWRVSFPNGVCLDVSPPQTSARCVELFSMLSALS